VEAGGGGLVQRRSDLGEGAIIMDDNVAGVQRLAASFGVDERDDALAILVGQAQPLADRVRHSCTDGLVMKEAEIARRVVFGRRGRGLSEIVQQRREPGDRIPFRRVHRRQRVLPRVVRVELVLRQPDERQRLWQHSVEHSRHRHQP